MQTNHINSDDELMRTLCRMVIETRYDDLPDSITHHAKRSILDTLAVTVGGSAMEGIETIVDFVKDRGGKPESFIPFYGGKVIASEAGLAIGPMSRAMDFGDNHEDALHCSEYIFPTLLAASGLKTAISGKEFITAFTVGSEVLVRIGTAFKASKALATGGNSGHFIFGCVAAVGKLLGLSLDELEQAQGIASEMTQPHSGLMYSPPTDMIRMHHGFICQDAINACLLAQRGITGPCKGVLSDPGGYLGLIKWETNADVITTKLGVHWELTNLMMKRYPCVAATQGPIDGIREQMKTHSFTAADITKINLILDADVASFVNKGQQTQWHPQTTHDCQFSIPYGLAVAAYTGTVSSDSYTTQTRQRDDIRHLMGKITIEGDGDLAKRAVRLETTINRGETFPIEYAHPKGHPKNPLTDQDLKEKFTECARYSAYPLNDAVVDGLISTTLQLEQVTDFVNALIVPVTPIE